jgi:hypothetical protein
MKIRYVVAWLVMLVVAFINGGLRDFTYGRHLSALAANQLSCLSGVVLLGAVIYLYQRRWPFASPRQAWYAGLFWMSLTTAFEFLFFHYVGGAAWGVLLANYDIVHGRLWPLILLWVAVAPYVFYRFADKRG